MKYWNEFRSFLGRRRRDVRAARPNVPTPRARRNADFSRRAFIGGAGAVLALPFLESIAPRGAFAGTGQEPCPTRLLYFYVPNGIHMQDWTPTTTGAGYEMTRTLQPLEPFRDSLLVLSGLGNAPARVPVAGDHARGTGSFLTCTTVKHTEGNDIENGISCDQVAANSIGDATRYASLQLGLDGGASVGGCDSGYSCAYTRNISWADSTTPLAKTTNPQVVFDRLFEGFDPNDTAAERDKRKRYRSSVLDYVLEESTTLEGKLGTRDRAKLDEYMTGVRELETRIQFMDEGAVCDVPGRPDNDYDVPGHARIMIDLMTLAFQCDQTRISSFMLANAGSNRRFDSFLNYNGSPMSGQHHELSHHQGNTENHAKLQVINHWEIEQFAYLLESLQSVTEPDGSTLLDNSLCFFSSEIADGNSHSHFELPVLLAGRGGGAVTPGRHLSYDNDEPLANLFLTMLDAAGATTPSFGDSTGPLDLT